MWAWLYLGLGALAGALTWAYAVRESAVVFTSAMSAVLWAYLALVSEVEVAGDTGRIAFEVGPIRWVFTAFALLALVALTGAMLGIYPDNTPEQRYSEVS